MHIPTVSKRGKDKKKKKVSVNLDYIIIWILFLKVPVYEYLKKVMCAYLLLLIIK